MRSATSSAASESRTAERHQLPLVEASIGRHPGDIQGTRAHDVRLQVLAFQCDLTRVITFLMSAK
jgi:hypothetical protein